MSIPVTQAGFSVEEAVGRLSVSQLDDRGFSIEQAAERWSVSPWTVRKWLKEGKLASVKLGSRRIIPSSEIPRVLREGIAK